MLKLQTLLVKVQADTLALVANANYSKEAFQEVIDRNLNLINLSEVREVGQYLYQNAITGEYHVVSVIYGTHFKSSYGVKNWLMDGSDISVDKLEGRKVLKLS